MLVKPWSRSMSSWIHILHIYIFKAICNVVIWIFYVVILLFWSVQ